MAAIRTRPSSSRMPWKKRNPIIRSATCSKPKRSGGNDIAPPAKSNTEWWTPGSAARNRTTPSILALTDKVIRLAQAQLAKSETAEMHTYAGLGWALKVRVYALARRVPQCRAHRRQRPHGNARRAQARPGNGGRHRRARHLQLLCGNSLAHRENSAHLSWEFPAATSRQASSKWKPA